MASPTAEIVIAALTAEGGVTRLVKGPGTTMRFCPVGLEVAVGLAGGSRPLP